MFWKKESIFSSGNPFNSPSIQDPRVFDPNIVSNFSAFPIWNPEQHHHPQVPGADFWKQLQRNNLS
jgi:hypothetical protein